MGIVQIYKNFMSINKDYKQESRKYDLKILTELRGSMRKVNEQRVQVNSSLERKYSR